MSDVKCPNFDLAKFSKIRDNVYILKDCGLQPDTKIYKYMNLSILFAIMSGKFRLSKRSDYSDKYEHGEITLRSMEYMRIANTPMTDSEKEKQTILEEYRMLSGNLLTSCFTAESDELHCMWKSFTDGYMGVRIGTTINSLIDSLDLSEYDVFIGKIIYSKYECGAFHPHIYLFEKSICYKPENEVRIYFVPKNDNIDEKIDDVYIDVSGERFIKEIYLSPFIPNESYHLIPNEFYHLKSYLLNALKNRFPCFKDKIHHSSLRETCKI